MPEPLQLIKPQDWRKPLVESWKQFRKDVGFPCDLGWGCLMNRIFLMTKQVDEMTGEIFMEEIPLEKWERQLEGFRRNEYAKKAEYPFGLFQKQFGSYNPPPTSKGKKILTLHCHECKSNYKAGERCKCQE